MRRRTMYWSVLSWRRFSCARRWLQRQRPQRRSRKPLAITWSAGTDLYSIGRMYGVSAWTIASANHLRNPNAFTPVNGY